MDNQECQPCWEAVQKYLGKKSFEMLEGTFEPVAIHEDGGRDHHLVVLKIPCSRQQGESNGGGNGQTERSSSGMGVGGSIEGSSEEAESLDYADILPEAELNQILADFMESADEMTAHHSRSDESITVTNEQLLHAAIDKHLVQQSKASNPSMVATNSEVIPAMKIKEEDEDEIPIITASLDIKEEHHDEEMVDSEPDQQNQSASPEQLLPSAPPNYSFAVPSSSTHHSQRITRVAAATPQNRILRPANLPAVSALMRGSGNRVFNRALARYPSSPVARTPTTIGKAKFRPSILFANPSSFRVTSPIVNRDEGPSLESFILEEGYHKIRRLGLHPDADDSPFKCPLCNKEYRSQSGIRYHAKYGHGPRSIFTCSICQREYATKHGLQVHRKTHKVSTATA